MLLQTEHIVHRPFAYDVGPLQITGFGLAVLMAFWLAQIVSQRELARRGHDPSPVGDLVFVAVIGSLVCAKLYYALTVGDLSAVFSRAGFVFWGGLIGGIVSVIVAMKIKKLDIMQICDVAGPAIAAAYAVGRTGCWAVGDDYGRPWNSRWAVAFPEGAPPSTVGIMRDMFGTPVPQGAMPNTVLAVHPTQIYEVAMGAVMFAILWRLRDHKHAQGWLFGLYCVLAGIERFIVEFYRAKDDRIFGPFTVAQMIALAFMLFGAAWMAARWRVREGAPGIYGVGGRMSGARA